ncbi:MAG: DNA polymerase III subunit gamma/tau C-terminal domain-containing protein, partial [Gallionella sp.]
RCLQFNLKQLPPVLITAHLQHVLEQEKIDYENGAITLISRAASGSMRDALSLMDQAIAFADGKVEESAVSTMLGAIDQSYLFDLLTALHEQQGAALLEIADNMAARSIAFDSALQELATLLHRIALAQTVPDAIADDEPERVRLMELAQVFTPEDIQLYYQIAIHGRDEIDLAPDEYAGFTMTLLRMLAFAPSRGAGNASAAPVSTAPAGAIPQPSKQPPASDAKSAPIQTKPTQSKPEQAPPAPAAGSVSTADMPDWTVLLTQLNVSGMAQQLAKHCVMQSFTEESITLCLPQENKHLQSSKMATGKLEEALSEYLAKPIKLNVVLGKTEVVTPVVTPAVIEQQDKDFKQQQANESIAQDDFVREAQAELGASLIEESIKPLH